MIEKYIAKSEFDSAIEELCKKYNISYGGESMGFGRELAELSDRLTAADVKPEKYGQWERTASMSLLDKHYVFYHCTACGRGVKSEDEIKFEYCPFCGAKMGGKGGEQK